MNASLVSSDDVTQQKRAKLLLALKELQEQAAHHGSTPYLHIALAEAEFRLAVLPDTEVYAAIEHLRRSIEHDPFHPKLFLHLGRCLHKIGDYQGAVHRYRHALKLAPTSRRTMAHLALSLLELGQTEREIGRDWLKALLGGTDEDIQKLVAELDKLIDAQRSSAVAADKKVAAPVHQPLRSKWDGKPKGFPGEQNIWRIALISELLSTDSKPDFINTLLGKLESSPSDLAVMTLLQVVNGLDAKKAQDRLNSKPLAELAQDDAIRLAKDALTLKSLAQCSEFVAQAAQAVQEGRIPVELMCSLHYGKCGASEDVPIGEAVELLDAYPPSIQQQMAFQELRIAILDGYARKYWNEKAYERARLVWGEMTSLDPHRTEVEHNLALIATRTRDSECYASSWSRVAELLYIHAAIVGDVRVLLDERKTFHLAFLQQSVSRYAKKPAEMKPEELERWMNDHEALDLWLKEWNLYYINARLSFHSPVHLLGVRRDASDEIIQYARTSLLQIADNALNRSSWKGVQPFVALLQTQINQAAEDATDVILRARDPYYELENAQAIALFKEVADRMSRLSNILRTFLVAVKDGKELTDAEIALASQVSKCLLTLPLKLIEPILKEQGTLDQDQDLIEIFTSYFVGIVIQGDLKSKPPKQISMRLNAIDDCLRVVPDNAPLKRRRLQLLLFVKRNEEAYASAIAMLDTLPILDKDASPAAHEFDAAAREELQAIIDNAAILKIPDHLFPPKSADDAEQIIATGLEALKQFPRAHGLRNIVANLMRQLGKSEQAGELLKAKLDLTDDPVERGKLQDEIAQLAITGEVESLLQRATKRVNDAYEQFNKDPNPANLEALSTAVNAAIEEAEHARRIAQEKGLSQFIGQADQILQQFSGLHNQLRQQEQQHSVASDIETIVDKAVKQVVAARQRFENEQSLDMLNALTYTIEESIQEAQRAQKMAHQRKLDSWVNQIDNVLKQFRELQSQINQTKRR